MTRSRFAVNRIRLMEGLSAYTISIRLPAKKDYGTLTCTKEGFPYSNTINLFGNEPVQIPQPRLLGGYERMGSNDNNLLDWRCNVKGALICHGKCALDIAGHRISRFSMRTCGHCEVPCNGV